MTLTIALLGSLTIAAALAAMGLRNLVHCALALGAALAGVAFLYLALGAEFIGFAQVLVYIGAVAILVVFAILLTRGAEPSPGRLWSAGWGIGAAVAVALFILLAAAVLSSTSAGRPGPAAAGAPVKEIGEALMTRYVLPLEVLGILLTATLIGAVVLALKERDQK